MIFRQAMHADLVQLAETMRAVDRVECSAFGHTPMEALYEGWLVSYSCLVAEEDGVILAAWGVTPVELYARLGAPWMLCAESIKDHKRAVLAHCRAELERMRFVFPKLVNYVADENRQTIRWLTWLGFAVEAEVVDIGGVQMRRFSLGL